MNSSPSMVAFRRTTRGLAHRLLSRAARLVTPKNVAVVAPSPSGPAPDELSGPLAERLTWLCGALPYFSEALKYDRELLDSWGGGPDACLPPECYREKDVLDLGCGIGASSALLVARRARLVWGIDPTLTDEHPFTDLTTGNILFAAVKP